MHPLFAALRGITANADVIFSPIDQLFMILIALADRLWLIGLAVAAVVGVTIMILRYMKKKKEEEEQ